MKPTATPAEGSDDSDDDRTLDVGTEKPMRKGRVYFKSGHVQNMFDCETAKFFFVKCRCMASYDVNIFYHVTVTLSKDSGYVKDASCDCKARRTYSRLHLFTTRLNCREPIGSRPCSVHCPDYTTYIVTTRSTPSDSLNAADVYAPWCHLVFRHASVMTAVVIG